MSRGDKLFLLNHSNICTTKFQCGSSHQSVLSHGCRQMHISRLFDIAVNNNFSYYFTDDIISINIFLFSAVIFYLDDNTTLFVAAMYFS